jgi:hypothetical protein
MIPERREITVTDRPPLGRDLVAPDWAPTSLDTGVATPARMYSYYLGGKDHFAADREAAEELMKSMPAAREFARANRAFLTRAVRHLAAEEGLGQFLDIGIGLPAPGGTSETAQAARPGVKVVGVDNDPIVLAHARAHGAEPGAGPTVVSGDVRSPEDILKHPAVREGLDFDQPIAVLLVAVLHFVTDDAAPYEAVGTLMDAVVPGSVLVLSHVTGDLDPERINSGARVYNKTTARAAVRSGAEIAAFFDGLDLLEPGVVLLPRWRPDGPVTEADDRIGMYGGIGRKR